MKLIPTSVSPVTITLYREIPFDNTYNDHPLIDNLFTLEDISGDTHLLNEGMSIETFLEMTTKPSPTIRKLPIFPRTTKTGTYNFGYGNGLVTSIILELNGDEINANYMKVTLREEGLTYDTKYYYFITGVTQRNESTYLLNLELDVIATFQYEMLRNLNDKPVMVERKHCRRLLRNKIGNKIYYSTNVACMSQESIFKSIKARLVENVNHLKFSSYINGNQNNNEVVSDFNWLYIIRASTDGYGAYKENDISYPYVINVIPLKRTNFKFRYNDSQGAHEVNYVCDPSTDISYYEGDPNVLKMIISPFPPFEKSTNMYITKVSGHSDYDYQIEVLIGDYDDTLTWTTYSFYSESNNAGTKIAWLKAPVSVTPYRVYLQIINGFGGKYLYDKINEFFPYDLTSINDAIDVGEYKLMISPFKELRMSSYYGSEFTIPTNLIMNNFIAIEEGETITATSNNSIEPFTIASTNAESNSYYDCADVHNYDVESKRGLNNAVAYNVPTSVDAMELFNLTAKNQFETSKSCQTLKNIVGMTGDVLSGAIMQSAKATTGMIKGIGSSIVNEYSNIEMHNAKLADLENTPDKYSFGGSSYSYDKAISMCGSDEKKRMLPFIITYTCDSLRKSMVIEYLYNYGYEYNSENYFNYNLYESGYKSDMSVFTRQIFNYVKIREDITSKLMYGYSLPLIVAKKINEILNAGIKFWTFFGMDLESDNAGTNIMKEYYQKTLHCNAEIVSENLE